MRFPVGLRARRRRGAPPPDSPRDVVLVLRQDAAASPGVLAATRSAAAGGSVTVVLPLRVHGYAMGLPNPGLMPTARERSIAEDAISRTVRLLQKGNLEVDGQIVVTRNANRAVVDIARRRAARQVLVDQAPTGQLRRLVEGDVVRQLSRKLGPSVTVGAA
jgi:hypothetical protein